MTTTSIHQSTDRIVAKPHSSSSKSNVYFANVANIVCLFWFNSRQQLDLLDSKSPSSTNLSHLSYATSEFRDYIRRVLHQTQLPPTAVSLALLYILRLKRTAKEPLVACQNSEYRVFSVALILANKFLDDNTYTNKTWSDITKLPLKEVSAMEIEFLSNMRYNMIVHKSEWCKWQSELKVWLNIAHQCRMSVQPLATVTKRMFEKSTVSRSPPLQMPTPPSGSPRTGNSPQLSLHHRPLKRAYEDIQYNSSMNHKRPHLALASPPQTQYPSPYAPLYPVQTLLAPQLGYPYAYPPPSLPPPCAPMNFVALPPQAAAPLAAPSYYACHCASVPVATVATTTIQIQPPSALYP